MNKKPKYPHVPRGRREDYFWANVDEGTTPSETTEPIIFEAWSAWIDPYTGGIDILYFCEALEHQARELPYWDFLQDMISYNFGDRVTVYRGHKKGLDKALKRHCVSVTTSRELAEGFRNVLFAGKSERYKTEEWQVDQYTIARGDILAHGHSGEREFIVRTSGLL